MNERRALGLGLCAVLLWSTVATAFKLTLQEFSPIQMLAVAITVSAGVLLILCLIQKKAQHIIRTFISKPYYYLLLGLINPLAYYLILFKAYDLLPASQAQSINYSWAITLTLMAAVFLGQKIRKQDWIACSISYLGVIVIATQGDIVGLKFESPLGVSLALFSTLLWAGYWILNTKNTADPIVTVLLGFMVALPFAWGLVIFEDENWSKISLSGWLAVIYVGLFEMGITFVLWLGALRLTQNTARISNLIFISPFLSLILLSNIIGEPIHAATVAGLIFIIVGLVIQQIKRSDRNSQDLSEPS